MKEEGKGFTLLMLASIIWGGGYIATSMALDGFSTFTLLAIRFLLSSVLVGLLFSKEIKGITKSEIKQTSILGLFLFLAFMFQTLGVQNTSISNNSFLTALNVVFTPYLVWMVTKKKPKAKDVVASVLSLAGVALLTVSSVDVSFNLGDLYSLLGAVFFAAHVVWSTKLKHVNHIRMTFVQMLASGLIALAVALIREPMPDFAAMNIQTVGSLAYLIVGATFICYLLQMYSSKVLSSNIVSIVLATEALYASVFSIIFLGEIITAKTLVSMALMLCAVLLSSIDFKKKTEIEV